MATPNRLPEGAHDVVPVRIPPGSTHFRLRKGGPKGQECVWDYGQGVTTNNHPIDEFLKDDLTRKWGWDLNFQAQFFQETEPGKFKALGAPRKFGITAEVSDAEPVATDRNGNLIPTVSVVDKPDPMANALSMLMALKGIAREDTVVALESERLSHEASLASQREFTQTMMAFVMASSQKAPATDPALVEVLKGLTQQNAQIMAMLEGEGDDEETEEEADARKMKELMGRVKREGYGALWSHVKDLAAEELVDQLPNLKAAFPALFKQYVVPMLEAKMKEMASMAQAAAAAQAAPKPAPPRPRAVPRPMQAAPPQPVVEYPIDPPAAGAPAAGTPAADTPIAGEPEPDPVGMAIIS